MPSQRESETGAPRAAQENGPPPAGPRRRLRPRLLATAALLLSLAVADLARPPADQWSARTMLAAIDLYQATLSTRLPVTGVSCRYEPTCSRYAEAVIARDGALVGGLRSVGRILRCGPWTEKGTVDEP